LRASKKHLTALLESKSIEEVERGIKDLLPAIARVIAAAKRPASESELGRELAMLVAAFPHGKADVGFSAVLIRYVADMRPSIGAVMLARRHLILSAKFLPAVSEVREAIKNATYKIIGLEWEASRVPKHLARLKEQQRHAEEEKRKKEERERKELELKRERRY